MFGGNARRTLRLWPNRWPQHPAFRCSIFLPSCNARGSAQRLARPAPPGAQGLSDGFRLPGREGEPVPAAVLVPLINRPQGLQLLLTNAARMLADHPGQISFPGGRLDPGDADHAAAALRETAEEIGLPPAKVDVLGQLSPYETVSGYRVLPIVGWIDPPFELAPDPVEVADVFEVPLDFILDTANHQRHSACSGRSAATTGRYPGCIVTSGAPPPRCC